MPGQGQLQRRAPNCRFYTENVTESAVSHDLICSISVAAEAYQPVNFHLVPQFTATTCSQPAATAVNGPESTCYESSSVRASRQPQCTAVFAPIQNLPQHCQSCLPEWLHCKWWSAAICFFLVRFHASSASFHPLLVGHCRHDYHHPCGHDEQRHHDHHGRHRERYPTAGHWRHMSHYRKSQVHLYCLTTLLLLLFCISSQSVGAFSEDGEPSSSHNSLHHNKPRHKSGLSGQKQTEIGLNITRILNAFFDSGYDKRVRPNYAGPPVEVGVTMHIISISSISAVQMDFTSDFYFRQAWRDSRLSFKPRPGIEALYVGAEVSDKIWVPDTFFANEKSAQFHMATTPNTFIRIKASGEVFRSMRLTVTSSCPMNLQYFPMDRQSCTIEIESYGYSMADIQYKWGIDGKGEEVKLAKNLELPQFKVNKHRQKQKVETLSTGNYSRLVCEIEFVRSMGYYLIQIYIPASLIVIISWVSFWLHRNASPARVQLGVTTVLTMTTLMSSTNAAMPKISYIKSIDVFLGTCFVMVFAALLEYATVGYMGKRIAMRKTRTQQILKILNEHREKCIIAAAAASSNVEGKDGLGSEGYSGGHRNHSGGGHSALIRTASLYPCLERSDPEDGHSLHKRQDFRSSSTAGHACYQAHDYSHQHSGHQSNGSRPLERSSSLKSRVFSDCDDPDPSGMNNFNDDLSVFVPATSSGCPTAVGGASSMYNVGGSLHQSTSQSPHYHYQSRQSASDPCYHGGKHFAGERSYLPSYGIKDHNTLFGVCPSDIDKYSRVVFPVCFLCFNLMYWVVYM